MRPKASTRSFPSCRASAPRSYVLLHRVVPDGALSFVRLDLEPPAGILPEATGGSLDVWIARAVAPGDVLRDVPAVLAALEQGPEQAALPVSIAGRGGRASTLPVRASVASTAGFAAAGASSLSRASLDVSGTAGDRLRWGASGAYARLAAMSGERTGDASRVALDLASGSSQTLHLSTRQQIVADDADGARFAAHSLDWNGTVSERSQASVSARLISQSRAPLGRARGRLVRARVECRRRRRPLSDRALPSTYRRASPSPTGAP